MNKKIKIFVSIIVLIGVITIAGFTLKINSANKGIKIEDPGTLYIGGITDLIISPEEGSSITEEEIEQKYKWLAKYYPNIKKENIFFICSTLLKPEVIIEYCKHYNIDIKQTAFVDDRIDVLRKAETLGIDSYHPSSFTE